MILETLCSIGFVASWLSACTPPATSVVGYVEGEYVQIAPIDVARIVALNVRRGDLVKAGETIGSVEATDAEIAVRNAEGALAQAKAELANILYGRRPEEIAAIQATLDAAKVQTEDNKRLRWYWVDRNGDGEATAAEVTVETAPEIWGSGHAWIGDDFTWYTPRVNTWLDHAGPTVVRVKEWLPGGAPVNSVRLTSWPRLFWTDM